MDLHFKLLLHAPFFPNLAFSDYYLVADLKKKILQGKKFGIKGGTTSDATSDVSPTTTVPLKMTAVAME